MPKRFKIIRLLALLIFLNGGAYLWLRHVVNKQKTALPQPEVQQTSQGATLSGESLQ